MPSTINNQEIRHRILDAHYKNKQGAPRGLGVERNTMLEKLQVSANLMDFNMSYLEEKGLVKLFGYFGALWNIAQITAFGMDVIENKEQYGEKFPFIKTIIQEIHGDVIGPVIQTVDSQITFNQQMNNGFQQAYEMNKTKEDISNELRKTTEKN